MCNDNCGNVGTLGCDAAGAGPKHSDDGGARGMGLALTACAGGCAEYVLHTEEDATRIAASIFLVSGSATMAAVQIHFTPVFSLTSEAFVRNNSGITPDDDAEVVGVGGDKKRPCTTVILDAGRRGLGLRVMLGKHVSDLLSMLKCLGTRVCLGGQGASNHTLHPAALPNDGDLPHEVP